jgi:two-component system, OmpR family, sensor histidine kinase TctE
MAKTESATIKLTSIRRRLAVPIIATLVIFFALDSIELYRNTLASINTAYDRTLLASARSISETIRFENGGLIVGLPYAALEVFEADTRSRMVYRVSDFDGAFLSGHKELPAYKGESEKSPAYAALVTFYEDVYQGEPVRAAVLLQPVSAAEDGYRMVTVQVAETLELRRVLAQQTLTRSAWQQLALIVGLSIAIWWLIGRGLRPIERLRDDLLQRDPDALQPVTSNSVVELSPLVAALNEVLARLRHVLGDQQRFVRDASHQLRTPLAVLKVQVQNARRGLKSAPDALAEINDSVDRATRVANQMLSLAKVAQAGEAPLVDTESMTCDLLIVARDIAVECSPLISQKHLDFALEFREEVPFATLAHEWMVRELLRNLLGNAIHYTGEGGTLGIAIETRIPALGSDESPSRTLYVWDSGPGISTKQWETMFQPFSTGDVVHGAGLGLLICRDICRTIGAKLDIENRSQSKWFDPRTAAATGLLVTVRFA